MKGILFTFFLIPLAGCANQALQDWADSLPEPNANYGELSNNYQEIMKSWFSGNLRDPYSAVYSNFSTPKKEHIIIDKNGVPSVAYGYSACVFVNAKNGFGGYTGNQQYYFFIQNEIIVKAGRVDQGGSFLGFGRVGACSS